MLHVGSNREKPSTQTNLAILSARQLVMHQTEHAARDMLLERAEDAEGWGPFNNNDLIEIEGLAVTGCHNRERTKGELRQLLGPPLILSHRHKKSWDSVSMIPVYQKMDSK